MSHSFQVVAIDDDQIFTDCLKTHLEALGLCVATINDPALAANLDFKNFKVVLLDLEMPFVSGSEILSKIPQDERPLVIVISSHHDVDTRVSMLTDGADYFLSKPINLSEVGLIVQRALGRTWSNDQNQQAWTLSPSGFALTAPCGQSYGLSHSEFMVLEALFLGSPNPISLAELEQHTRKNGGAPSHNFRRSLEVMLSRMRKRFSTDSLPFPVKSVRNMGYVFHGAAEVVD